MLDHPVLAGFFAGAGFFFFFVFEVVSHQVFVVLVSRLNECWVGRLSFGSAAARPRPEPSALVGLAALRHPLQEIIFLLLRVFGVRYVAIFVGTIVEAHSLDVPLVAYS